jgi:hypothetical protein
MQAEDFISLPDILRAVALLRNANVPMIKDRYACVIDSAGIQQLALGDSRFGDRVEAFKDSKQRVLSAGDTIDYAGVLFTRNTRSPRPLCADSAPSAPMPRAWRTGGCPARP